MEWIAKKARTHKRIPIGDREAMKKKTNCNMQTLVNNVELLGLNELLMKYVCIVYKLNMREHKETLSLALLLVTHTHTNKFK